MYNCLQARVVYNSVHWSFFYGITEITLMLYAELVLSRSLVSMAFIVISLFCNIFIQTVVTQSQHNDYKCVGFAMFFSHYE